ncbi:hypothetical protein ACHMW7_09615 [Aminobacter sp. UC22_36]|uniref:hypothetical protein n=1 Tax=Aminobacter sp. UC22_36 TaxID=3374549 RepID=UPI0037572519
MAFLLVCFVIGLVFLMLFSQEGRGCLGGLIGLIFIIVAVTVLGALLLGGGLFALLSFAG